MTQAERDAMDKAFWRSVTILPESNEMTESYIRNCHIVERKEDHDTALFRVASDGKTYCRLDGYAIVPKELYYALREAALVKGEDRG